MADYKPGGVTIKRDGNAYSASWTVSSNLKKHGEWLDSDSKRERTDGTGGWVNEHASGNKLGISKTGEKINFNRSDFYPCLNAKGNKHKKLKAIHYRIRANKKKGKGYYSFASASYVFSPPGTPSVSLTLSDNCDSLTAAITAPEGSGKDERYDTVVKWQIEYWVGGRYQPATNLPANGKTNQGTDFSSWSGDLSSGTGGVAVNMLNDDEWVRVRCCAYCRGLAGDSGDSAWAEHLFGKPEKAVLKSPVLTSDQVLIPVEVPYNANCPHPTDSVQLYRYIGTSRAASADDWTAVDGACDNGYCNGLHDSRAAAEPNETGQRVWYMIKSTHDNYSVWSDPVECVALHKQKDTSPAAEAYVVSATNNADGDSATVVCGWQNDSSAAYDTTVVSWSTDQSAWRSTDEPDSHEMKDVTWQEEGTVEYQGMKLNHSSVKVLGLDDGKRYWFRARRISSSNDQEGSWSKAFDCLISSTPTEPVLSVPGTVERGKAFTVTWASGGTAQASWRLMCLNSLAGSGVAHEVCIAQGLGNATSTTVPAGEGQLAGMDSAKLAIEVSSGGDYVRSDAVAVAFADPPTATVTCGRKITAAGHAVTVAVQPSGSTVSVSMTAASSVSAALPDGSDALAAGDVVWSEKGLVPGTAGVLSLTVPDTVHLIDGARYRIAATPECGGLTGEAAEPTFSYSETDSQGEATTGTTNELYVEWAHQAAAPEECSISLDSLGRALVCPTKPDGAAETDTWSLYRDTPDGFAEIASGVAFGAYVLDAWPPFASDGECGYRVATFTADGDCDYADFGYESASDALRIDWPEGSVTLDGNLSISDSYAKAFEARTFLDQPAQGGTWAPGIERSCSVDWEGDREEYEVDGTVESLRALARYSSSCFVRFPDGCAYEADVQVNSLEVSDDEGEASVSLDITEVELTSYMGKEVTADGLDSTV